MYYDTNMNRSKKPHAAYLYDTHVHTSESSPCGRLNAQETVRLYSQAGFSGFCITDHYTRDFFFLKLYPVHGQTRLDGFCADTRPRTQRVKRSVLPFSLEWRSAWTKESVNIWC